MSYNVPSEMAGPPLDRATNASSMADQLQSLYDELGGDRQVVDRFVRDYLALLDRRVARIRADLQGSDDDETVTALLSLETTSVMIGAPAVVEAARAVRTAVERQQQASLLPLLERLVAETAAVRQALEAEGYPTTRA